MAAGFTPALRQCELVERHLGKLDTSLTCASVGVQQTLEASALWTLQPPTCCVVV